MDKIKIKHKEVKSGEYFCFILNVFYNDKILYEFELTEEESKNDFFILKG